MADTRLIDARLLNWSRWSRGGLPRCETSIVSDDILTIDALDAERVESVMLAMKRTRERYWQLATLRYGLNGSPTLTIREVAKRLAISETACKAEMRSMLAWVDGRLSAVEEP